MSFVTRRNAPAFLALFSGPLLWILVFMIIPYVVMISVSFWTGNSRCSSPTFSGETTPRSSSIRNTPPSCCGP